MWPYFTSAVFLFASIAGDLQGAPNIDTSGNSTLKGDYFMREVVFYFSASGDINRARSVTGVISFDGNGNYQFTGQQMDSTGRAPQPASYSVAGQYVVRSNGLAEFENPADRQFTLFGEVTAQAVVASSTEDNVNDLFIALPASTVPVSNSRLQGNYWVGSLDLQQGRSSLVRNALFLINPNGQGGLATVNVTGNAANLGNSTVTQAVSGATYSLSGNGAGTISFPLGGAAPDRRLVGGDKVLYVSQDGNYLLGGSSSGFDIFAGIKGLPAGASNASYQGLYYLAGLDENAAGLNTRDGPDFFAYAGSLNADGNGKSLWHERLNHAGFESFDSTFSTTYSVDADGTITKSLARYALGAGGNAFVAIGNSSYFSLVLATRAPSFSGAGVFLSPVGIVNAASFAPITNSVAPGEFVTLFGSGLSPVTMVAQSLPFPTILGGVQVMINGRAAPVYAVSPGQISAIVPYANTENLTAIQVVNNGTSSNSVTLYTNSSAPGVFTLSQSGTGPAAILHADAGFNPVSANNPAKKGETVLVFVTGLGAVDPPVADGAAGPSSPLSRVVGDVSVFIDGKAGTVGFAGLAPGFAGLYQINVQVPASAGPGEVLIEVDTPDAETLQATMSVAP